ncbi:putative GNAT family acetyltransferase [Leptodontidium sp. MPI-SDFR-AT-0119]|nr:putative GNAT family acetyltransferase [Leptodontidium sp. MPI-SDFR-AT-0119]
MSNPLPITIQPATYADIPALAQISGDSFEEDRHTQMKGQRKKPYNMYEKAPGEIRSYMSSEKCVVLKAVDETTGAALGWSCWGFRGFEAAEIPRLDPGQKKEKDVSLPFFKDEIAAKPEGEGKGEEEEEEQEEDEEDIVKKLEAMTDADMKHWMETLMPPGTKCMFVVSLSVAPAFQARGVGSALLKWGTDTADNFGVFIWAHSSESAWTAYARHGFEIVGTLDVNLDVWAPKPPPKEEGPGAIWGHYVFRYTKRLPKSKE